MVGEQPAGDRAGAVQGCERPEQDAGVRGQCGDTSHGVAGRRRQTGVCDGQSAGDHDRGGVAFRQARATGAPGGIADERIVVHLQRSAGEDVCAAAGQRDVGIADEQVAGGDRAAILGEDGGAGAAGPDVQDGGVDGTGVDRVAAAAAADRCGQVDIAGVQRTAILDPRTAAVDTQKGNAGAYRSGIELEISGAAIADRQAAVQGQAAAAHEIFAVAGGVLADLQVAGEQDGRVVGLVERADAVQAHDHRAVADGTRHGVDPQRGTVTGEVEGAVRLRDPIAIATDHQIAEHLQIGGIRGIVEGRGDTAGRLIGVAGPAGGVGLSGRSEIDNAGAAALRADRQGADRAAVGTVRPLRRDRAIGEDLALVALPDRDQSTGLGESAAAGVADGGIQAHQYAAGQGVGPLGGAADGVVGTVVERLDRGVLRADGQVTGDRVRAAALVEEAEASTGNDRVRGGQHAAVQIERSLAGGIAGNDLSRTDIEVARYRMGGGSV